MQQRLLSLSLAVCLPLLALLLLWQTAVPAHSQADPAALARKADDALRAAYAAAAPDEPLRFILHLPAAATLHSAAAEPDVAKRRQQVVTALQQTAAVAQAPLLDTLSAMQQSGAVSHVRPFWIINAIAVTGSPAALEALAADPAVAAVTLDAQRPYFDPPDDGSITLETALVTAVPPTTTIKSWGIDQINAPAVWHGLGIDGSGVTVAIMDTGVDWTHPDLMANYRGNLGGGVIEHTGNWYTPLTDTLTAPVDFVGHGTHVAGTAVGQNGVGVAPGANWIAVGLSDGSGLIFDSNAHAGFEWLLAPGGDPARAPDIVNGSWGTAGWRDIFFDDVAALHAAGIVTIFAAGNSGPTAGSIGAPASYPGTIAVAASDEINQLAWFSSRGPSPLAVDVRPQISAPGTTILSTIPNAGYGLSNGTSMAAPHVSGAAALLLQANPTLNSPQLLQAMTDTAVPINPAHPNNDSGYGRLDAYAAVAPFVNAGTLRGMVRGSGIPLPNVTVTLTTSSGAVLTFTTDSSGRYEAQLQPGSYTAAAAPFGHLPAAVAGITVNANATVVQDLHVTPLPTGIIRGRVYDDQGQPLSGAAIAAAGTPLQTISDANGRYTLRLPENQFKLQVTANGFRLGHAIVLPQAGATQTVDFTLTAAPAILLVDAGQWHYDSQISYYAETLQALNYAYTEWEIRHPFDDKPDVETLSAYDVVVWSDPTYAPGYLGLGRVISDYLGTGGDLLISGQNLGLIDGGSFFPAPWWTVSLNARYVGKTAVTGPITGAVDTPFADVALTLNGGSSAANQQQADVSQPRSSGLSVPALTYEDETAAGLLGGYCQPYHIAYFGFGLEGVSDAADRAALVNRAFTYFEQPRQSVGVRWEEADLIDFALPGTELVYTVTVRNMSELLTDTFSLSAAGSGWQTELMTHTLELGPCETGQTQIRLRVPAAATADARHSLQLTAVSQTNPFYHSELSLDHKVPGHILLVDDDRWYDAEAVYQGWMDAAGLSYDVWETGWRSVRRGSPPADLIAAYDMILWFTGNDWFAPITPEERQTLTQFLADGGRLFLSSQDFLFYHWQTPLAQTYFGIAEYQESMTPTVAYAGMPALPAELRQPLPLSYEPYSNYSDGLIPQPTSEAIFWHNQGLPAAVATADTWRAILMGIPLEMLPPDVHGPALAQITGWLGDLGDSTFTVDQSIGAPGAARTFTVTVHNNHTAVNQITLSNPLPPQLTLTPGSLSGGAAYDAATRRITWSGALPANGSRQFVYTAVPDAGLPAGSVLTNSVTLAYARHGLDYTLHAPVWVGVADLSTSSLTAAPNRPLGATAVTYTLTLHNSGSGPGSPVTATVTLPPPLYPLTDSVRVSAGTAVFANRVLTWTGSVDVEATITATIMATRTSTTQPHWLPTAAIIQEPQTGLTLREHRLYLPPYVFYMPFVSRGSP